MFIKDLKPFVYPVCFYSLSEFCNNCNNVWTELCSLQSTSHTHSLGNFSNPGSRQHGLYCALLKEREPETQRTENKFRSFHDTSVNIWLRNAELFPALGITKMICSISASESHSVMSDSLQPCGRLSMEFSRPEYWSRLLFPSPQDLPNPGIEPRSPVLQEDSLPAELPGKPCFISRFKEFCRWLQKNP